MNLLRYSEMIVADPFKVIAFFVACVVAIAIQSLFKCKIIFQSKKKLTLFDIFYSVQKINKLKMN